MADHKLKSILGSGDKIPNHGSSGSQSPLQKRIADLESVVQRLQKQMAINDDPMATVMKVLTWELCRLAKFRIT